MEEINLAREVEGQVLFENLKNSNYMKIEGYKILYAKPYYDKKIAVIKVGDKAEIENKEDNNVVGYGICYNHNGENRYLHICIPVVNSKTSSLSYFITMGNKGKILKDLEMLINEVISI